MLTALITALAIVLLFEVLARLFYPRPKLRREPQVQILFDDRIGYRNRPNQRAFNMDAPVTVNSLGFRGPEFAPGRQPGSLRILGLGNSITFGAGVADGETYLAHLESRLASRWPEGRVEVLNAAMDGFTIRQYIPFLEEVLPKVKPDVVLLGAHWRDLHYNPRFGQLKGKVNAETWKMIKKKMRQRADKTASFTQASPKEQALRVLKNLIRRWRALFVLVHYLQALKGRFRPSSFQRWQQAFLSGEETEPIRQRRQEARKTLGHMKKLCEEQHIKFGVLLFPDCKQTIKAYPQSTWPLVLVEACQELDIPYADLLHPIRQQYREHGRAIFLPYDTEHYSASCHGAIAGAVGEFLERQHLLSEVGFAAASELGVQEVVE